MSRLIDADALIESMGLENAVKWGNKDSYQQNHSYSTMMLYEIKDAIDWAPTVGGWISVKDRLPEKHVDVLINVLCDSGDFVCTAWLEDRGWNDDAGGWSNDDVTHWMPLPEPPEGKA